MLAWASLFAGPAASAGSWVLANGDQLRGELVRQTDREIVIDHPVLGRLAIPRTALSAAKIESTSSPGAVLATGPENSAPQVTEVATTARRILWKRQIELGFARSDGGAFSKEDLSARAEVEARLLSNSYRASVRVLRSESDDVVVVDRQEADFRWRHDFSKRLFAQSLTSYAADDIRRIDLSLEQQLGGGYRVIDAGRHQMNLGVGAVVRHLAREGEDDNTTLLGSTFQDYTLHWNDRFKLTQEATLFVADRANISGRGGAPLLGTPQAGNYRVRFNAAVQTKMTEQMSLNLRYEYDYDRSIPDPILRSDARLTTSLGYLW